MTAVATNARPQPLRATVARDDLLAGLQFVEYAVGRSQLPILQAAMLTGNGTSLNLRTFDYERECIHDVAAPRSNGVAAVDAKLLRQMVTALPKGCDVHLSATAATLKIEAAGISYTAPQFKVDEFPSAIEGKFRPLLRCRGTDLRTLAQVVPAAGSDDTLPVLTGVYLHRHPDTGKLVAAATDRYRLAVVESDIDPTVAMPDSLLVPARTLRQVTQWFGKDDDVRVSVSRDTRGERLLRVYVGARMFTTRLLDGEFPKYRSLLPTDHTLTLSAPAAALLTAVQQAAIGLSRSMPIRMGLAPGEVVLRSGYDDDSSPSARVPVPEATYEGDPVDVGYNPTYLRDGFRVFGKDDVVTMAATGPTKPATFTSAGRPGFTYLLMPVRLAG